MEYSVLSPIFHCPIFHLFFPGEYHHLPRHISPRLLHKRGRGEKFEIFKLVYGRRSERRKGEGRKRREEREDRSNRNYTLTAISRKEKSNPFFFSRGKRKLEAVITFSPLKKMTEKQLLMKPPHFPPKRKLKLCRSNLHFPTLIEKEFPQNDRHSYSSLMNLITAPRHHRRRPASSLI